MYSGRRALFLVATRQGAAVICTGLVQLPSGLAEQLRTASVDCSEIPEIQVMSGLRGVSTKLHSVTSDRAGIMIQSVINGSYAILRI